jgi:hypothetical protein
VAADPDERHHMTVLKGWAVAGAAGSCSRQHQGDVSDDPPTPCSPRLVLGMLQPEMRRRLLSPVTCHVRVGRERHQGLAAVERLDGDRQVQNRARRSAHCPLPTSRLGHSVFRHVERIAVSPTGVVLRFASFCAFNCIRSFPLGPNLPWLASANPATWPSSGCVGRAAGEPHPTSMSVSVPGQPADRPGSMQKQHPADIMPPLSACDTALPSCSPLSLPAT